MTNIIIYGISETSHSTHTQPTIAKTISVRGKRLLFSPTVWIFPEGIVYCKGQPFPIRSTPQVSPSIVVYSRKRHTFLERLEGVTVCSLHYRKPLHVRNLVEKPTETWNGYRMVSDAPVYSSQVFGTAWFYVRSEQKYRIVLNALLLLW